MGEGHSQNVGPDSEKRGKSPFLFKIDRNFYQLAHLNFQAVKMKISKLINYSHKPV
jgi:hypothetical protein